MILDEFIPLISSTKQCNNRQEVLLSADEKIPTAKAVFLKQDIKRN
jgi:hypothetical protein